MRQVAATAGAWASPLLEIERSVQERAKVLALDMARPEGRAALRDLLDDEVRHWTTDVKRGVRSHDLADPGGITERAWRNLAGYGPLEPLLADPDVWEIMINAPEGAFAESSVSDGRVWRRRALRMRPRA